MRYLALVATTAAVAGGVGVCRGNTATSATAPCSSYRQHRASAFLPLPPPPPPPPSCRTFHRRRSASAAATSSASVPSCSPRILHPAPSCGSRATWTRTTTRAATTPTSLRDSFDPYGGCTSKEERIVAEVYRLQARPVVLADLKRELDERGIVTDWFVAESEYLWAVAEAHVEEHGRKVAEAEAEAAARAEAAKAGAGAGAETKAENKKKDAATMTSTPMASAEAPNAASVAGQNAETKTAGSETTAKSDKATTTTGSHGTEDGRGQDVVSEGKSGPGVSSGANGAAAAAAVQGGASGGNVGVGGGGNGVGGAWAQRQRQREEARARAKAEASSSGNGDSTYRDVICTRCKLHPRLIQGVVIDMELGP